jgi:hypothetical protein
MSNFSIIDFKLLARAYDQNQGYTWSGYKNFVVGNYTKARFVLHIKAPDTYNQQSVEITIDGVAKKQRDVHLPADTWCRLAYNSSKQNNPCQGTQPNLLRRGCN